MYIKINNKKIEIKVLTTFKERFKSFKFYLEPITYGLCFPKRKIITTYFLCQRIDIIMTDKEDKILYIYPSIRSEKIIFYKRKVYYTYFLPVGCANFLKVGEKLKINHKGVKK